MSGIVLAVTEVSNLLGQVGVANCLLGHFGEGGTTCIQGCSVHLHGYVPNLQRFSLRFLLLHSFLENFHMAPQLERGREKGSVYHKSQPNYTELHLYKALTSDNLHHSTCTYMSVSMLHALRGRGRAGKRSSISIH